MEWKVGSLASIMLSIIWEDKAFCQNNSKAHVQIVTWQQINMTESTDSTQRSESNSDHHEDSDILTISDSCEDKEWGETDTNGRDVCPSSNLRC